MGGKGKAIFTLLACWLCRIINIHNLYTRESLYVKMNKASNLGCQILNPVSQCNLSEGNQPLILTNEKMIKYQARYFAWQKMGINFTMKKINICFTLCDVHLKPKKMEI